MSDAVFPPPVMPEMAYSFYTHNGVKLKVNMDTFEPVAAADVNQRGGAWLEPNDDGFQELLDRFGYMLLQRATGAGDERVPCYVEHSHGVQMARDLRFVTRPFVAGRFDGDERWTYWDQHGFDPLRHAHSYATAV